MNTLEYKGFTGIINFSKEDHIFFGKIAMINDLVTFEGSTVIELEKAFEEAVEDYVATCKKIGKEPEKAFKGTFNVRLSPNLHKKAYQAALQENISLNRFIEKAVENELVSH